MKRLQVGDECYLRNVKTLQIHKTIFDVFLLNFLKKKTFRLVYPFPCVKELAV